MDYYIDDDNHVHPYLTPNIANLNPKLHNCKITHVIMCEHMIIDDTIYFNDVQSYVNLYQSKKLDHNVKKIVIRSGIIELGCAVFKHYCFSGRSGGCVGSFMKLSADVYIAPHTTHMSIGECLDKTIILNSSLIYFNLKVPFERSVILNKNIVFVILNKIIGGPFELGRHMKILRIDAMTNKWFSNGLSKNLRYLHLGRGADTDIILPKSLIYLMIIGYGKHKIVLTPNVKYLHVSISSYPYLVYGHLSSDLHVMLENAYCPILDSLPDNNIHISFGHRFKHRLDNLPRDLNVSAHCWGWAPSTHVPKCVCLRKNNVLKDKKIFRFISHG